MHRQTDHFTPQLNGTNQFIYSVATTVALASMTFMNFIFHLDGGIKYKATCMHLFPLQEIGIQL